MNVSVLIPVFNAASTIGFAVKSILRQTYRPMEVLIVDDGSTDETPTVLARLARADTRIRVVRQANAGIVAALNHGLALCNGALIARMDADDYSLPARIGRQVQLMTANPALAACGTAILPFYDVWWRVGLPQRMPSSPAGIATRLLFNPPIMHPTAMIRRAILDRPDFYPADSAHAEDYALWSRIARTYALSNVPQIGLLYRKSMTSISAARAGEQQHSAAALRLDNLAALLGQRFAEMHGPLHLELIARKLRPPDLVAALPEYLHQLCQLPQLDRKVLADLWFGYCLRLGLGGYRDVPKFYGSVPALAPGRRRLFLEALSLCKW